MSDIAAGAWMMRLTGFPRIVGLSFIDRRKSRVEILLEGPESTLNGGRGG
jgi:hypothetical protein